jgi:hypothetical protein
MNSTNCKKFEPLENRINRKTSLGNIKDPPNHQILRKKEISGSNEKIEKSHINKQMTYQNDGNANGSNNQKK